MTVYQKKASTVTKRQQKGASSLRSFRRLAVFSGKRPEKYEHLCLLDHSGAGHAVHGLPSVWATPQLSASRPVECGQGGLTHRVYHVNLFKCWNELQTLVLRWSTKLSKPWRSWHIWISSQFPNLLLYAFQDLWHSNYVQFPVIFHRMSNIYVYFFEFQYFYYLVVHHKRFWRNSKELTINNSNHVNGSVTKLVSLSVKN